MSQNNIDIFERMLAGGIIRNDNPQMAEAWKIVFRTIQLSAALNTSTDVDQIRERLSEITGSEIDKSTMIFVPFYTNFGQHIKLGKRIIVSLPAKGW